MTVFSVSELANAGARLPQQLIPHLIFLEGAAETAEQLDAVLTQALPPVLQIF